MRTLNLLTIIVSAMVLALYGFWGTTLVNAQIYSGLEAELCMADAYGGSLVCTANDVEISKVVPVDANGQPAFFPDGTPNPNYDPVECTLGETFELIANITIRTNANERYDTTFYLPLTEQSPMDIQVDLGSTDPTYPYYCSLILPENPPDDTKPAWVNLDFDECGDISKAFGTDEYTLEAQTITMLCIDEDENNEADFNYCAAWDNKVHKEGDECTVARDPIPGTAPGTKSKCKCDTFNIPVFIAPDPPAITKTLLTGPAANEPGGIFQYLVTITKSATNTAEVDVTALEDIVRSSTDNNVLANFDLTSASDQTAGGLTYLATDSENSCDEVLFPVTLTSTSPTLTCILVMEILDDDLDDTSKDEVYNDFIRATVLDKNDDLVGDNTCDLTAAIPVDPDNGTCSNVVEVTIDDLLPAITIDKFAIDGPGFLCSTGEYKASGECTGPVYIDEPGGNVTYKLIITNTSTADPLTIPLIDGLLDDVGGNEISVLALGADTTCDEKLAELAISGQPNDSFDCTFVRAVIGEPRTVRNDVTVSADESDGHSEGNMATASDFEEVTITDVPPAVTLLKQVKVAGDDDNTYTQLGVAVDEPAGDVVYRFTVTNTSVTKEAITLMSIVDPTLFNGRVTQTGGTCLFNGTVVIAWGTPYVCTIEATVIGNAGIDLPNTAYVTVKDNDGDPIPSNDSSALVTFDNVQPDVQLFEDLRMTIFITITNPSTFESVYLSKLSLEGQALTAGPKDIVGDAAYDIIILGDNGGENFDANSFNPFVRCVDDLGIAQVDWLEIVAGDDYSCYFTVELLNHSATADNAFSIISGSALEVIVNDEDDGSVIVDRAIVINGQLIQL
ncbi:MAG: hypothetical protein ACI8PB_001811 [Desulforhopalus sp.]|jgi:hypothetical protein